MVFWFSYQIEIEAFGAGKTITAPDCNTARACTFKEFIKYIAYGDLVLQDWSKVRSILIGAERRMLTCLELVTDTRQS